MNVKQLTKRNQANFDYCVEKIDDSSVVIMSEYEGLSVTQLQSLKREIKKVNGVSKVLKNKIAQKAFDQASISLPESLFKTPRLIWFPGKV